MALQCKVSLTIVGSTPKYLPLYHPCMAKCYGEFESYKPYVTHKNCQETL